jgi:hypothetical protein
MPKLIITREGVSLRDYPLDQQRTTIGRKPDNDVYLDDQTVSSEHAAVSLIGAPAITDLGSTNGTFVNGVRISKQDLKHGDVIRIGQHELKYIDEQTQDLAATVVFTAAAPTRNARLHVVAGARAGTVLDVTQDRTTLGKPGGQIAVLLREAGGFRLLPMAGKSPARVNQQAIAAQGVVLSDGDEIDIAGSRLRFEVK